MGTSVADLEIAWQDRLAEADILLAAGRTALAIHILANPFQRGKLS